MKPEAFYPLFLVVAIVLHLAQLSDHVSADLRTCEICNSVACNVVGPTDMEAVQQVSESHTDGAATATSLAPAPSTLETRTCLNGHRFLNFLLACMVFAFVISWLFHFNIPS